MAFWGVEVKPGKPFTHKYEDSKGRLHISMATLGLGTATAKSTLQCNVGNRSPVYLCSLYPGNAESLQLNLELEEVDQVLFSVIGPRSIHLCGYYLATAPNANLIDDSESFGEDIADTETERSDYSDEDGYDDSFIDDDIVPEASSPSLISKEEEASHDNGPKIRKVSLRRLRKMYQSVESDDDGCGGEKIIVNDRIHDQVQETDNEDSLPISSIYKNKASGRVLDNETDVSVVRGAGDASNNNEEDGGNNIFETNLDAGHVLVDSQTYSREAVPSKHLVDPCTSLDVGDIKSPKKKKKKKEKEAKSSCNGRSIKLDNVINELKMEEMTQVIVAGGKQEQHVDDKMVDNGAYDLPDGNQSENRKAKKRKKMSKSQGNGEVVNSNITVYVERSGETEMMEEDRSKGEDAKHSNVRTLKNGLVIHEQEKGKKDGKIAASGKKISIYYTGKLKENGAIFESNAGQTPFKFRLGKGEVIEGWDVGLEGMQVGEKRRLVIPPTLTSESDGHSDKIPPSSWLIYDIELIKVH
ncbi:peptidyl-prolyl cis-trans isomerase FKBP43-like isoform X5 [Vigna umbellata]|uniref:peptidyl-prolyl cis-trans isomerase FKBP43-like isoform X5 n=1 Tax=Vigna umbellata TaxID=87088 RepID=UPI001F5FC364|nr:peptidyl-prolyl cis-trans isomerase FKBP43-like isoform X5 [Vigna umbellata]